MNPLTYNVFDEQFAQVRRGGYANPFYVVSNQFLPRNFNDVIRWSRFVMTQSPTVTEVLRKLSSYPITDFMIETPNEGHKKKYKEIIASLRLKHFLTEVGFDHYSLGNVYISIYFPIKRSLRCTKCNTEYDYANSKHFIKFKNFNFEGECIKCGNKGIFTREDRKSMSVEDLNLIRWPVENVSVHRNPITNSTEYYLSIPNFVKKGIITGDPNYIGNTPWSIIEAVKDGKDYKFDNKNFFHLKNLSFGDFLNGYGLPPLISIYSLVYYQVLLRRANEAIASEHMTPLRVVSPRQGSGAADPAIGLNMRSFARNMEENIKKFKKDPNHIAISPVPAEVSNIGGEGRALLITQELQFVEETMLMGLGCPRELMAGTANWTSSTVGLRLLENTLERYVVQIKELLDWIVLKINAYFGISEVELDLIPFKLTDDEALRTQLAAMVQSEMAAPETYMEAFGMDYEEELEKIKKNAARRAAFEIEREHLIGLTRFAKAKDMVNKNEENEDYNKSMEEAANLANQIKFADDMTQREMLMQIRSTDPVLFTQVITYMQQMADTPTFATMQQQAADPNDPNATTGGSDPGQEGDPNAPGAPAPAASPDEAATGAPAKSTKPPKGPTK